jgi:hypothetical protein
MSVAFRRRAGLRRLRDIHKIARSREGAVARACEDGGDSVCERCGCGILGWVRKRNDPAGVSRGSASKGKI